MLPAHLAQNIKQQVLYYLQSTFDFRNKLDAKAFQDFLNDEDTGLFKGPWVQLHRPYRPSVEGDVVEFQFDVPFTPFKHQNRAWRRLASGGQRPKHTIVTTGTGSGKTECFLFPVLDHCLRMKAACQQGIKAIVLYPMNALATDQEKRLAKTIWRTDELRAAGIRVGNYTGRYDPANPGADTGTKKMGENHGISSHAAQQTEPPDILLTNYKMLDYLLLRPQDQNLWRFNEPGVLQYLILDELHTYDGAQGADVACLIRRLKSRLSIVKGEFSVVGTSATLDDREAKSDSDGAGDGSIDARETGSDRLAKFASTLFEEDITSEAVIGEDRLTVAEIVLPNRVDTGLPSDVTQCEPQHGEDALHYAIRIAGLWGGPSYDGPAIPAHLFSKEERLVTDEDASIIQAVEDWSLQLGGWLKGTKLFKDLLDIFHRNEQRKSRPLTWAALVEELALSELELGEVSAEQRNTVCASFFALVAQAKEQRSGTSFPLVPTQVQLWIRELRRLGRAVDLQPRFTWLDEPAEDGLSLPTFHCSECGESGWVGLRVPDDDSLIQSRGVEGMRLSDDPSQIYRAFFGHKGAKSPLLVIFSPMSSAESGQGPTRGEQHQMGYEDWYICPKRLVLRLDDGPCPLTNDEKRFRVKLNRDRKDDKDRGVVGDQKCPNCGEQDGVFFIGSQGATLSSVAIDELFGSVLNNDPKLLAFTDSVQDASHRAGFFTARTYHFTFRTALQHVLDEAGPAGIPLPDVGKRMLRWWTEPRPGWQGELREAMASLLPPDLHGYADFLAFRNGHGDRPPQKLLNDIERRLTWEATSEFGLMQTHGRTMESSGSSCVAWDERIIESTIVRLRERLPQIDQQLCDLSEQRLRLWVYGFLHRGRLRGAMFHPYLSDYARSRFWGKYPFGRTIEGREVYPPNGRFMPRLLVTKRHKDHDHVTAASKSSQPPWQLRWIKRALERPHADETSLLDLIHALLVVGAEKGLFLKVHEDGKQQFYAIASAAARLTTDCTHLVCSESGRSLVRAEAEAKYWDGQSSDQYYADKGKYKTGAYRSRQRYYQDRYRKGALRRVVASEHTGLLETEARENLEQTFATTKHTDDPNVLTCTSTLEMGIDIGDLSSTMLCSIPPNTASYLQRIGRAGRSTGTALIVSVVNQRPHDLFFYGRPAEMLRGKVDPPGCWLDASAVLVRQYLAFCFDTATSSGELQELPKTGKRLIDDMNKPEGHIPRMLEWVTRQEPYLRRTFLDRLKLDIEADTRERFAAETDTDLLRQKIHQATSEFDRQQRELSNARTRLNKQLSELEAEERDAKREINQELKIVKGRLAGLNRTSALEILTDSGLLPNYAFPERGVRFYGSIYNKHRSAEQEHGPVDVTRAAGVALRELAPSNHFYTHRRRFEIQQIAIGNRQDPIIDTWAICGACGHMRLASELGRPGTHPACPQCGHDHDAASQLDKGQQRGFIEFSRSQAISHMEHYESLAGDRGDERDRAYYQLLKSFDLTKEAPRGSVGEETLPFGIEYRASVTMREVNVGYQGGRGAVAFGVGVTAPEEGFRVCNDCGVVMPPEASSDNTVHRRSCKARKRTEKQQQQGRTGKGYSWESVYLYRELQSEAIRLLLPVADDEDVDTLTACLHLGLRLRFEGNPAHLIVTPQISPDSATGMNRYYLLLMDAVPGGTGYLKTLFQERDGQGRQGEGLMEVLRLAKNALETCACRQLKQDPTRRDTNGCYRCIRTYHLQYSADAISRERGIALLDRLIGAGEQRVPDVQLDQIKPNELFGSMLEKKFVDRLLEFVKARNGLWEETIIKGSKGFRFSLPESERIWELELQPRLGPPQGVSIACQPDFLLHIDDEDIKPIAIFTDGFEFHCHPENRLRDDMQKRRAIRASGKYLVWSITWEDLDPAMAQHNMVCHGDDQQLLETFERANRGKGGQIPSTKAALQNGLMQLLGFLDTPHEAGWTKLATFLPYFRLQQIAAARTNPAEALKSSLAAWSRGDAFVGPGKTPGDWVYNDKVSLTQDVISLIRLDDALNNRRVNTVLLMRLGDRDTEVSGSDYRERWRRFLACLNLYQFLKQPVQWAASEVDAGTAPEIPMDLLEAPDDAWGQVSEEVLPSLAGYVQELSTSGLPVPSGLPCVEYFNDQIDDDAFAELAWASLKPPIAVLAGEQASFAKRWQTTGWEVITHDDLQANGCSLLIDRLRASLEEI